MVLVLITPKFVGNTFLPHTHSTHTYVVYVYALYVCLFNQYQYFGPTCLGIGFWRIFVGGASSSSSLGDVNCRTISFNLRRKISLIFSIWMFFVYFVVYALGWGPPLVGASSSSTLLASILTIGTRKTTSILYKSLGLLLCSYLWDFWLTFTPSKLNLSASSAHTHVMEMNESHVGTQRQYTHAHTCTANKEISFFLLFFIC